MCEKRKGENHKKDECRWVLCKLARCQAKPQDENHEEVERC